MSVALNHRVNSNAELKTVSRKWDLLLSVSTIQILFIIGVLALLVDRGLDITDEGLYLTSIQHPEDVYAIVNLSHYYSYFLYKISFDNIVILRGLSVFLRLFVSLLLIYLLIKKIFPNFKPKESICFIFSIIGASCSTYMFSVFTPHYNFHNSIAVSTMLVFFVIIITSQRKYFLSCVLFSMGIILGVIWLIKPTTFVACAAIITLYFLFSKQNIFKYLFLVSGISFCFLFHILFVIDFSAYYKQVSLGLESIRLLKSGHLDNGLLLNFFKQTLQVIKNSIKILWAFHFLLFSVSILSLFKKFSNIKPKYFEECIFVLSLIKILFLVCFYSWQKLFFDLTLIYFAVVILLIHILFWHKKKDILSFPLFPLGIIIGVLPLAGIVGTTNSISAGMMVGGYLYLYAILALMLVYIINNNIIKISFLLFLCAINVIVAIGTVYYPYRLNANYFYQTEPIQIGNPSTTLKVDFSTRNSIEELKNILKVHGFQAGNDIIGFSRLNGLTFAVGGRAPGTPWYVSGYPGAKEYNTLGLSLIPKERLLAAWILIADSDRDSVPNFKDVEISFDEKYQKVAEIIWPVGNKKIEVYKPTLLINSVDVTVHN